MDIWKSDGQHVSRETAKINYMYVWVGGKRARTPGFTYVKRQDKYSATELLIADSSNQKFYVKTSNFKFEF